MTAEASLFGSIKSFCSSLLQKEELPRFPLPEFNPDVPTYIPEKMVTDEQRQFLLKKMRGPSKFIRSRIINKYSKRVRLSTFEQQFLNIRNYLRRHTEWDGYCKAIVWETLAEDLNEYGRKNGYDHYFYSSYHQGSDGSFVFTSSGPKAVIFAPNGDMYKGMIPKLGRREIWKADYSTLKKLRST